MAPLPRACVNCNQGLSDSGRIAIYILAAMAGLFCLSAIYYYVKESRYEQAEQRTFNWSRILLSSLKFATFLGLLTWLYHQYKLNKARSQFPARASSYPDPQKPAPTIKIINDSHRPATTGAREKRPKSPSLDFVAEVDEEHGQGLTRLGTEAPKLKFKNFFDNRNNDKREEEEVIQAPKIVVLADGKTQNSPETCVTVPLSMGMDREDRHWETPAMPRGHRQRATARPESQTGFCNQPSSADHRHGTDSSTLSGDECDRSRLPSLYGDAQRLASELHQTTEAHQTPENNDLLYLWPGAPPLEGVGMYVLMTNVRHSV